MKSLLSLLATLAVIAALAGGGYWLYQRMSGGGDGGGVVVVSSQGSSLALTNGTHYALTVDMRKGAELVHFQILPGHSETRSFAPGDYQVQGKISDANTDPFSTQWSFQAGGHYNATFSRDGQGIAAFVIERVGGPPGAGQKK